MGFVATNLAKIPAEGFNWYLFVLTDSWDDPIQNKLLKNFDNLSSGVGKDCLVVRGANPETFYNSLLHTELGKMARLTKETPFPSLVLSSHSIGEMDESKGKKAKDIVVFLIPLRLKGDLLAFLRELTRTIKSGNPSSLFGEETKTESKWAWLADYLELKPNFFGLGLNLNPLFEKIVCYHRNANDSF